MVSSFYCFGQNNNATANEQLDQIKQAIRQEQGKIKNTDEKRITIEKQLRLDDIAISKVANKLNQLANEQEKVNQELKELKTQQQQLTQKKKQQEELLAKQIRAAYTTGNNDYLKLLLNQEDPSAIERTLTYYQYLNDARIGEIESFKQTINELLAIAEKQIIKSKDLEQLKIAEESEQASLLAAKEQRKQTVVALNQELQSSKAQLAKLIAEEANLVAELARLAELAKQNQKLSGLAKLQGKLPWPVAGKIEHAFGSAKQGYLKWKGTLISAPTGKPVTSIYRGTVLFADWLKGYGLVTVVDHGEGYMSLYGHNQTLLKNVGDRVEQGEPIALVGQSGGQAQANLYFEIRLNGQAVNPDDWCK